MLALLLYVVTISMALVTIDESLNGHGPPWCYIFHEEEQDYHRIGQGAKIRLHDATWHCETQKCSEAKHAEKFATCIRKNPFDVALHYAWAYNDPTGPVPEGWDPRDVACVPCYEYLNPPGLNCGVLRAQMLTEHDWCRKKGY